VLTVNRGPSPDFNAVHGNRDPPVVEARLAVVRAAMLQEELGELCHGDEEASVQHHRWDVGTEERSDARPHARTEEEDKQ
jgi:hypothetical protein